MNRKDTICTLSLMSGPALHSSGLSERLANAFVWLEYLDWQRVNEGDPHFGKVVEERIVWRELLDLELQQIDEDVERICASADKEL